MSNLEKWRLSEDRVKLVQNILEEIRQLTFSNCPGTGWQCPKCKSMLIPHEDLVAWAQIQGITAHALRTINEKV